MLLAITIVHTLGFEQTTVSKYLKFSMKLILLCFRLAKNKTGTIIPHMNTKGYLHSLKKKKVQKLSLGWYLFKRYNISDLKAPHCLIQYSKPPLSYILIFLL